MFLRAWGAQTEQLPLSSDRIVLLFQFALCSCGYLALVGCEDRNEGMSATADVQTAAAAPPPPPMAPDGASGEPIPADVSAGGAGGAAEPALDAETLALARRMDAALRRAAMPEGAEGDAGSYVGWDSDDREYSSIFEMLERFAAARAALSDGAAAAAAAAAATDSGGKTHAPADAQGADGAGESDHQGRADGAGDRGDAAGSSLAWYSDAAAYWDVRTAAARAIPLRLTQLRYVRRRIRAKRSARRRWVACWVGFRRLMSPTFARASPSSSTCAALAQRSSAGGPLVSAVPSLGKQGAHSATRAH